MPLSSQHGCPWMWKRLSSQSGRHIHGPAKTQFGSTLATLMSLRLLSRWKQHPIQPRCCPQILNTLTGCPTLISLMQPTVGHTGSGGVRDLCCPRLVEHHFADTGIFADVHSGDLMTMAGALIPEGYQLDNTLSGRHWVCPVRSCRLGCKTKRGLGWHFQVSRFRCLPQSVTIIRLMLSARKLINSTT